MNLGLLMPVPLTRWPLERNSKLIKELSITRPSRTYCEINGKAMRAKLAMMKPDPQMWGLSVFLSNLVRRELRIFADAGRRPKKRQSFDSPCLSGTPDRQVKFNAKLADTTQAINQRMPTIFQLYL